MRKQQKKIIVSLWTADPQEVSKLEKSEYT